MADTQLRLEGGRFPAVGSGVWCAPDMRVNQEMEVLDVRIQKSKH